MRCPVCNFRDTSVIDSRLSTDGMDIRRRRECDKCAYRFSTLEEMEILDLAVVKRDGRREPYSRDKLLAGIAHSLEKRSVTVDERERLIHTIQRDIQKQKKSEITSREIGEIVMERLRDFDTVAYIRFASVYRQFEDVSMFEKELKRLRLRRKKVTALKKKKR